MKTVVSFSNTWCKNGMISEGDLHSWVWREYPAHLHRNMQRIFEKFQARTHTLCLFGIPPLFCYYSYFFR